jgi:2-oxo-4-hydroxy-4-carboxy-5-ureidoimidazoline decarboxylase
MTTIADVNDFHRAAFLARFGEVLEASPHLAASVWDDRPFASRSALIAAFGTVVRSLGQRDALTLLCAHPELGERAPMAAASVDEQRSAGLDDLQDQERARIADGNLRYRERFGFPFIIAVRGLGPAQILAALTERLGNDTATEIAAAIGQVCQIAALRIASVVDE